mgnify:CR=1 FL=1
MSGRNAWSVGAVLEMLEGLESMESLEWGMGAGGVGRDGKLVVLQGDWRGWSAIIL